MKFGIVRYAHLVYIDIDTKKHQKKTLNHIHVKLENPIFIFSFVIYNNVSNCCRSYFISGSWKMLGNILLIKVMCACRL